MINLKKQIKYQKSITSKINNAYSLIEVIISTTVFTVIIVSLISMMVMFYGTLKKITENALKIYMLSKLITEISTDALNVDLHPHHLKENIDERVEGYFFYKNKIKFFSNGIPIIYNFESHLFSIKKSDKIFNFDIIKDFNITYYNNKEFEIDPEKEFPYFCRFYFKFYDNKEFILKMKL